MHVFTYGSLMVASVMEAVTGNRFAAHDAVLRGYARYGLEGATYPGLTPQANAATDGVLYLDVDPASMARLDAFEGSFYDRVRVEVDVATAERLEAEVYVIAPAHRHRLSARPWHLDAFRRDHLAAFLASYHGFSALGD